MPLTLTNRAGQPATVGTLTIASSDERLWSRLRPVVGSLVTVGSTLMLCMGLVVWLLVHRLLVRPLTEFSDQVGQLEGAQADQPIQLRQTHVTEIATLEAGFNRLMRQIGEDQERIAEQNTTLEQKVVERTRALEAANKAKSEFLARMSHEIRTPMNAVIGLSELTLRTALDAQQRDYLNKVLGAAQALLGIINDILDFSKIEAGKLTLEHIEMSLPAVIDGVIDVVGLRADEKGLALQVMLAPDVPHHLWGDPTRLGQVLLNLVGNAIKFTEVGTVEVGVTTVSRSLPLPGRRRTCRPTWHGISIAMVRPPPPKVTTRATPPPCRISWNNWCSCCANPICAPWIWPQSWLPTRPARAGRRARAHCGRRWSAWIFLPPATRQTPCSRMCRRGRPPALRTRPDPPPTGKSTDPRSTDSPDSPCSHLIICRKKSPGIVAG